MDGVAKLSHSLTEARRALAVCRERELDVESEQLAAKAVQSGDVKIVRAVWNDRAIDEVKGLAVRVTSAPDVIVLFGVTGARTQLVFARSENVTTNLKPAFDQALAALGGGKGGGARILMGSAAPTDAATLDGILRGAVV